MTTLNIGANCHRCCGFSFEQRSRPVAVDVESDVIVVVAVCTDLELQRWYQTGRLEVHLASGGKREHRFQVVLARQHWLLVIINPNDVAAAVHYTLRGSQR